MNAPEIVQARHFTASSSREVSLVVIHTTEGGLRLGAARAVAAWFAGASAPQASAHYVVDCHDVIACVREQDEAWAAPGANAQGVHVEVCGRAGFTAEEWNAPPARATLELLGELVADICGRHGIPVRRLGPDELRAGERGICGHVDASKAWRLSDHYDPGPAFPWGRLLELASRSPAAGVDAGA